MRNIITIKENEEFLRQVSTAVNFEDDDYISYINELKEYCKNNTVYALAPVQIGIPKRLIYIKNTSEDMQKMLILIMMKELYLLILQLLVKKVILDF